MVYPSFANRSNLDAIESAYESWKQNPASVDPSWHAFFEGFQLGADRSDTSPTGGEDQTRIAVVINTYRDLGHLLAHQDPLSERRKAHPALDLAKFGFNRPTSNES